MDLVTIDECNDFFNNTSGWEMPAGGIPAHLITVISSKIEEYCNMSFGPSQTYTEYKTSNTKIIQLNTLNVTSITEIRDDNDRTWDDSSIVASDNYAIDLSTNSTILLKYLNNYNQYYNKLYKNLKITYVGGYNVADIPSDVKLAVYMQLQYEIRRTVPGSFAINPGQYSEENYPEWKLRGGSIIEEVKSILNKYKRLIAFI